MDVVVSKCDSLIRHRATGSRGNCYSGEQLRIIERVQRGDDVCVDAVAGSGKTTTVVGVARACPNKHILLLTYNAMLKNEVRQRLARERVDNVDVHNYHSLAVKHYDREAYTDDRLQATVDQDTPMLHVRAGTRSTCNYDIVVVDECQDMSWLFYTFTLKFMRDASILCTVQLLLLGDNYQSIYRFKDADSRFLTRSDACYQVISVHRRRVCKTSLALPTPPPTLTCPQQEHHHHQQQQQQQQDCDGLRFQHMRLSTTFRCPSAVAEFVNCCMLREPRMRSVKDGPPVLYIRYNGMHKSGIHDVVEVLVREITNCVGASGKPVLASEIFVLCPSTNTGKAQKMLENVLVSMGWPCYVSGDEGRNDESCMAGKVVFTTFHKSKGLERPLVVAFGFDAGYFRYYAKDEQLDTCPPTLYVAATRSTHKLIVIENVHEGPLPFLSELPPPPSLSVVSSTAARAPATGGFSNTNAVRILYVDEETCLNRGARAHSATALRHRVRPSQIVRHLGESTLSRCKRTLEDGNSIMRHGRVNGDCDVHLAMRVGSTVGDDLLEDVSNINGIAIPSMFEMQQNQGLVPRLMSSIAHQMAHVERSVAEKIVQKHMSQVQHVRSMKTHVAWRHHVREYLHLANIKDAMDNDYLSRLEQVKSYDWLSEEDIEKCHEHMRRAMSAHDAAQPLLPLRKQSTDRVVLFSPPGVEWEFELSGLIRSDSGSMYECLGFIDCLTPSTLWEFKCVESLGVEHLIQLCFYMWMWCNLPKGAGVRGDRQGSLLNIRTGEIYTLRYNAAVEHVIELVLLEKFGARRVLSDGEFDARVLSVQSQVSERIEGRKRLCLPWVLHTLDTPAVRS